MKNLESTVTYFDYIFIRSIFMSGKNSELIGFWVSKDVKAGIQEQAKKSKLSVSTFLRILLEGWLEDKYKD